MREEVISSGTMDQRRVGRSSSPPTPAASSVGASSPAVQANIGSIDWFGSAHDSKAGSLSRIGSQNTRTSLSTNGLGSEEPSCKPWERGDLLRRLATFKPSNWFEKPKEASSLACARKGWINIDTDKIECELCGIQLTFAALATSISAEVDSAEGVFAEKLDGGHKVTCPWRGNCCADSLVQFPPALQISLIGGYKDRCDGLLQFPYLPVIASDAIENMKISRRTQMDSFLSQLQTYSSGEFGLRTENTLALEFSREEAIYVYYKAQKLISLCGWEPRWLPNVQDYEEHSSQSARNADSFGPTTDTVHHNQNAGTSKNPCAGSAVKDSGKKKSVEEFRFNARFPLLDCSLCGATARIPEFLTIPRPARFGLNNNDTPDISKKLVLTRGASAASGINGWVAADGMGKEQTEGRDDAATADERKSLLNVGVDLNLTIAGGLPSIQPGMPAMPEHFNDGGMGRDLMIGQPAGSEVGDRAASYESRGPSTRKRSLEEGGSTVDRPLDRIQQVDSIEGTVIDRDCDEVDDDIQYSCGPSKRVCELDMFSTYPSLRRLDPSGAGPSRTSCFDTNIDVNRVHSFKEGIDLTVGFFPFAKESARASSVIAMDTIGHSAKEDSMESVENYPGDENDVHLPSTSSGKNIDMNEALEFNYSSQAQQSTCLRPAAGSVVRETGVSSTNEGEEILNAETVNVHARDRFSFGISGGSVGMGASHEAEIHGIDVSIQRTDSTVGDTEPVAEVTENLGQTGESTPGPGLMDEFVPEEMDREDPHGDSQDRISQSVGKADYASKVYGSTKADSVESREKVGHTLGHESSSHLSLSRNAVIYSGYEASKDEVTQKGKACAIDDSTTNGIGPTDDENNYKVGEFDPIKHHNVYCPWVNGNVAFAGCSNVASSSSSSIVALSGWELTLDALDTFQSQGLIPNEMVHSESAASLCKDDNLTPSQKLFTVHSLSKKKGKL